MIIKFGYYDDEDFGLTAFPEIRFSEMEIEKNKKENTIEGLYTLESIYNLIKKKKVYMPIIYLIKDIVDGKKEAKTLIDLLTSDRVFK